MSGNATETPDVAVVVPHTGSVSMRWAIRLATMNVPQRRIVTDSTAAIDLSRERAVAEALAGDVEWLLLLDSDVIPPADAFPRLLGHGRPVVSGLYYVERDGVSPAVWMLDDEDEPTPVELLDGGRLLVQGTDGAVVVEPDGDGLLTVDCVGLGCTLVHRSVFEAVERPWFRWSRGYDEHPWNAGSDEEPPGVSEDLHFCHAVSEAGFDVHLDPSVGCAHEKGCLLTTEGAFLEAQVQDW